MFELFSPWYQNAFLVCFQPHECWDHPPAAAPLLGFSLTAGQPSLPRALPTAPWLGLKAPAQLFVARFAFEYPDDRLQVRLSHDPSIFFPPEAVLVSPRV